MPSKTTSTAAADKAAQLQIPSELLDQLVTGPMTAGQVQGLFDQFKKAVLERALGAEMRHHLGYAPGAAKPEGAVANHRNGKSAKTVLTDAGALRLDIPRDREGSFEPQLIGKHERRFTGFDDKIVAMYARGMTVREIQAFLAEMYSVDVSPDLISRVTDEVMSEVSAWQSRPLESMYPVVFFDALRVKIREDGLVRAKALYLALGVLADGSRDILGLWIENTEGAKFWMKVFNDLKTRGVQDILIAVTDGLKGMPEALGAVFPATTLQTCIVHLIRRPWRVGWVSRHSLLWSSFREDRNGCPANRCQQRQLLHPVPDQLRWGSFRWPSLGEFDWPSGMRANKSFHVRDSRKKGMRLTSEIGVWSAISSHLGHVCGEAIADI